MKRRRFIHWEILVEKYIYVLEDKVKAFLCDDAPKHIQIFQNTNSRGVMMLLKDWSMPFWFDTVTLVLADQPFFFFLITSKIYYFSLPPQLLYKTKLAPSLNKVPGHYKKKRRVNPSWFIRFHKVLLRWTSLLGWINRPWIWNFKKYRLAWNFKKYRFAKV